MARLSLLAVLFTVYVVPNKGEQARKLPKNFGASMFTQNQNLSLCATSDVTSATKISD